MSHTDPTEIAIQFNEQINHQNLAGLSALMSEDHCFIDRAGKTVRGKIDMLDAWSRFFDLFPAYKNTLTKVVRCTNAIIMYGYATWKPGEAPDYAIWTATVENDLVAEWRIYEDSAENRARFSEPIWSDHPKT